MLLVGPLCPPARLQLDTAAGWHSDQQQRRRTHHVAPPPNGSSTRAAVAAAAAATAAAGPSWGSRRPGCCGAERSLVCHSPHPAAAHLCRGERVCAFCHSGGPGCIPQCWCQQQCQRQEPRQGPRRRRALRQRLVAAAPRAAAAALCRRHALSGTGEAAAPRGSDGCVRFAVCLSMLASVLASACGSCLFMISPIPPLFP
jgi:hypothetical protein